MLGPEERAVIFGSRVAVVLAVDVVDGCEQEIFRAEVGSSPSEFVRGTQHETTSGHLVRLLLRSRRQLFRQLM